MIKFLTKKIPLLLIALMIPISSVSGQNSGLQYRADLEIDVWTNKDDGATFHRGEDLVVYFQANLDCYALVYEIDTDGNINVLFPDGDGQNAFVKSGDVYRVPPQNADYHMEVGGSKGDEYIYAVASTNRFEGPSWMLYWGYEYDHVGSDWIIDATSGRNNTLNEVINRLAAENGGTYTSDYVSFDIEPKYRNYFYYPHHYYNHRYGSVWFGADYPGCEIFIDGIYYGVTPLYLPSILIGGHHVMFYYHGYPCWQDYFWVDYGHYYRYNPTIEYRYIHHINRGGRYKYWGDWDFGGKDYKRPKRYKDTGGYTYHNPEKIIKASDTKTKSSCKKVKKEYKGDYNTNKIIQRSKSNKKYSSSKPELKSNKTSKPKKSTEKSNSKSYIPYKPKKSVDRSISDKVNSNKKSSSGSKIQKPKSSGSKSKVIKSNKSGKSDKSKSNVKKSPKSKSKPAPSVKKSGSSNTKSKRKKK
ncbi:MAG: DUF4384 domain-containing protein [candidate division Zixibacteria bacterium]|nr:DUF4384 domain-containing protein [candidate division Zixibacteria bacterium]